MQISGVLASYFGKVELRLWLHSGNSQIFLNWLSGQEGLGDTICIGRFCLGMGRPGSRAGRTLRLVTQIRQTCIP